MKDFVPYKVALVDDHVLMRQGLASLINSFDSYKVIIQQNNGEEFIKILDPNFLPDIVLLDINMPKKDGFETSAWIKDKFPNIKILALSMYDNESSIVRMLRNGAKGYILKDVEPLELRNALDTIVDKGYYYSDLVTGHLVNNIGKIDNLATLPKLNSRELEFLKLCCTELGYKEIAQKMFVSPRTIEGYRDAVCEKLGIKSRVGLVMFAIKNHIVEI